MLAQGGPVDSGADAREQRQLRRLVELHWLETRIGDGFGLARDAVADSERMLRLHGLADSDGERARFPADRAL